MQDQYSRQYYGKKAGIVGLISNALLSLAKVIIGIATSSIAIIADSINNLSDAASSLVTLIGFKLSSMPEDEEHPYGHARIEYITGLVVSILVLFAGFSLAKASFGKIIHPETTTFTIVAVVVLVISIFVKMWQSRFYYKTAKKINSKTLKATASDSRNDVIATGVILLSLIINHLYAVNVDAWLGLIVSLFIIFSGINLIKETSSPLLGEAPDKDMVEKIRKFVLSYGGVLGVHDLVVHNYGPDNIFVSIHIEVSSDEDMMHSHDLIDRIERDISREMKIHFVAHMDPITKNDPVINLVFEPIQKCLDRFEGVGNIHDMRCVPGPTHTNIIFDVVMHTDCTATKAQILQAVENTVLDIDPTYNVVITFDKAYTR